MSEQLRLRAESLEWREVDGELIVLDLDGSEYMKVNGTGAVIWRELDRGARRDQLVNRLAEAFELDETKAQADVDAFLAHLGDKGLLAPASGP